MRRWFTLAVTVAAMTWGGMSASRAEDSKATGEHVWHDVGGKSYEMEKGHTYWMGEIAGKFFNDRGRGSLFDQAETKCFGFTDSDTNNNTKNGGYIGHGGYCVWTDAD